MSGCLPNTDLSVWVEYTSVVGHQSSERHIEFLGCKTNTTRFQVLDRIPLVLIFARTRLCRELFSQIYPMVGVQEASSVAIPLLADKSRSLAIVCCLIKPRPAKGLLDTG